MERKCSRCPQKIDGDLEVCPACGAPVVSVTADKAASASWRPVDLPDGLVDDGIDSAVEEQEEAARPAAGQQTLPSGLILPPQVVKPSKFALSPGQKKILLIMGGALLLLMLVIAVLLIHKSAQNKPQYVAWPWASVYPQAEIGLPIATLQRGEQVYVLGYQGQFVKVRDMDGKIGFMEKSRIIDKEPSYVEGAEFYGCRQYLSEESIDQCRARAQKQFNSCNALCKEDISGQCLATCQSRLVTCQAHCSH